MTNFVSKTDQLWDMLRMNNFVDYDIAEAKGIHNLGNMVVYLRKTRKVEVSSIGNGAYCLTSKLYMFKDASSDLLKDMREREVVSEMKNAVLDAPWGDVYKEPLPPLEYKPETICYVTTAKKKALANLVIKVCMLIVTGLIVYVWTR